MFKKTIIYILLLMFTFSNLINKTYAECLIKDAPAIVLENYFENIRTIVNNISNEASKKYKPKNNFGFKKDLEDAGNDLAGMWNNISNWGFYMSTFDFYVVYQLGDEIPNEIMRDNYLIEDEIERINNFTEKIVISGYGDINLTNVCLGVQNCNLSGKTIDILGELLKSTSELGELYRLSILDEKDKFSGEIILVPKNFKEEFSNYYNAYTTKDCSDSEGGLWERVKEKFLSIVDSFESGKRGFEEWEEAIALLNENGDFAGNKNDEMRLLREELSRQGLSLGNSQAIMENLEEYHDGGGYSLDNNFITKSFKSVKKVGNKIFNTVKDQVTGFTNVYDTRSKGGTIKQVGIKENVNINVRIKTTNEIGKEILEIFNSEKPFASIIDTNNAAVKGRLYNLHLQITQAISTLKKICPLSKKICNKQASNKGGVCDICS